MWCMVARCRSRGMANFSEWLSEQDVEDIRAALLAQATAQQAAK